MPLRKLLRSINIQLQKLDTMLLNDVRLFFRDKKSLILVALAPFIILAILINIYYFSDVAERIRGVELAVCDMDDSGFSLESDIFKVTTFTGNCEQEVADKVSKGEFRGAVVIPDGFQQNIKDGKGTEIKLFIDSSKSTTALVTSNAVKAYVSDLNEKIGTEFILEAWERLRELNENLKFLVNNLEKAVPVAQELQQRLDAINTELLAIDFDSQQEAVDDLISYLNLLEIQLDYIDKSASQINPNTITIPQYTPTINITIDEYNANALLLGAQYCNNTVVPNPVCPVLDYTDSVVKEMEAQAANISYYNKQLNDKIIELNQQAAAINDSISRLDNLISPASQSNEELRQSITAVRDNLLFLEEKTDNTTKAITDLKQSINQFLIDIVRVTAELDATTEVLDEYTQKDPATILRPVKVESVPVFKDKLEIFYRLPALISILLLFITLFISSSLIVNERRGGTMARIFLSPISMFFYVFEKMLYLLLLCALSVISMLAAAFLFGVPITININLILILIVSSLTYIAIGILIGSTSKSENTSLLTCLVIGFPLMFLSGAFSPPELMGTIVRNSAKYLPLTLNIDLFENITIYSTGLDPHKLLILAGMIVFFYLFSVLMIHKKPTLK